MIVENEIIGKYDNEVMEGKISKENDRKEESSGKTIQRLTQKQH